ncbi:MAG: single-strand selective monofunctional uracil-DNA glycosylase [Myxococcales bacterium]|jgi:single-strand selective monofunctional uracil DNA glycosylase|nr:single-strand selective monofunctional uracil-DNA glycosylase [Myxococcales bacterium]
MSLVTISRNLGRKVDELQFTAPVAHVYNPLRYARRPHERYLERWGGGPKEVLLLGMNPGPFGMAQTGVPFGDVTLVRDWLGIEGPVDGSGPCHPKRPVLGFDCQRSEVSGSRLWGWARDRFGTPERFFSRFFVVNYCPLCFVDEGGRNVTPDKLPALEREPLLSLCDAALRRVVTELEPRWVIGVGGFAHKQAARALAGMDVSLGSVLHPSPASPLANRGWAEEAEKQLRELGIAVP